MHTRYREPGGEDAVVDSERRILTSAGHTVEAIDLYNPVDPLQTALAMAASPWNVRAAQRIRREADLSGADVVHIHNTWFALSPAVVRGLAADGVRVVITFHNYRPACVNAMLFRDGQPCQICVGRRVAWPGVIYRCYRNSVLSSTAVAITSAIHRVAATWDRLAVAIALTAFGRDILISSGIPQEKLVIKPNFVADPGPRTRPPSTSQDYLFVGRLSPEKGALRLLDYWPQIRPHGAKLVIIGDGPQSGELAARVTAGVEFAGRLPGVSVSEKMLGARALLVPSEWYEGQPMVILEALAAGLPVVHSDLGALGETVGPGGFAAGLTVEGWQAAMSLTARSEDVDRLGAEARDHYERSFTEPIGLRGLEKAYGLR